MDNIKPFLIDNDSEMRDDLSLFFTTYNTQRGYQNILDGEPVSETTVEYIKELVFQLESSEKQIEFYRKLLKELSVKYNQSLNEDEKITVKKCQFCIDAWDHHQEIHIQIHVHIKDSEQDIHRTYDTTNKLQPQPHITDVVKAVRYFNEVASTTDVKRRSNKKTNKVAAQLREEAFFESVCQSIKKFILSGIVKLFWPTQIEKRHGKLEDIVIMLDNRFHQNLIRFFPPKVTDEAGDSSKFKSIVSSTSQTGLNSTVQKKIQQKRNKKRKNKKFSPSDAAISDPFANVNDFLEHVPNPENNKNAENSVPIEHFAVDSKSVKKSIEVIDEDATFKLSSSDLLKSHNEIEIVFHDYCCQTDYVDVDDPEEFGDVDPLDPLVYVSDYEC